MKQKLMFKLITVTGLYEIDICSFREERVTEIFADWVLAYKWARCNFLPIHIGFLAKRKRDKML